MSHPNYYGVLDRPIAYHPVFATITKSLSAAVLLSQMLYWSKRSTHENGWFYHSYEEWMEETGMTRRNLDSARAALQEYHLVEERYDRLNHRMFYRVDTYWLNYWLDGVESGMISRKAETYIRESTTQPVGNAQNEQSSISTETTSENTSLQGRKKPSQKTPRKRDEIFDAIATATGIELTEINQINGSMIAKAKQQILQSTPTVTPEEIRNRALAYRAKWPNAALTPTALAKHWPTLGTQNGSGTTKQQLLSHMP